MYEPPQTTVIPETHIAYPITEELPAIPRPRPSQGRSWGRNLGLLLLAVGLAVLFLFAGSVIRDRDATDETTTIPTSVPPQQATVGPEPTAEPTTSDSGYWQVVGVTDGLNVRSGPGTGSDVLGTLAPGQRHVFATGQSSGNWLQIIFGPDDAVGWVSARFLATDTAPVEGAPRATVAPPPSSSTSVVCFASTSNPSRLARIEFTDRVQISGTVVTESSDGSIRQQVFGQLANGQADLTVTDGNGTVTSQRWVFNPANVVIDDGSTLNVVNCGSIDIG
jgi:hypothetical protein